VKLFITLRDIFRLCVFEGFLTSNWGDFRLKLLKVYGIFKFLQGFKLVTRWSCHVWEFQTWINHLFEAIITSLWMFLFQRISGLYFS